MVSAKRIGGWLLALTAAGALAIWAPGPANEPTKAAAVVPQASRQASAVAESPDGFEALPAREALGESRGELFASRSWTSPSAPARKRAASRAQSAAPAPPPMPYRVAGTVVHEGRVRVVLAKGDRVVTVREGEILEDGYRVESITPQGVRLVYIPLGVAQELPATVPLDLAVHSPAQLRLEGPARIRAGDPFSVALKVTSREAVRAAPLQLSFDAGLLEAVDVRRGGFFADGIFTYRIDPAGSISIGASGKGAVPSDAEFFVATFKPVRIGTAELKLSSVLLQGAAGDAIAHDALPAFRASIVQ